MATTTLAATFLLVALDPASGGEGLDLILLPGVWSLVWRDMHPRNRCLVLDRMAPLPVFIADTLSTS